MAKLKSPFRLGGNCTAANSSQMTDGAAFSLLMSAEKAKELKLKPIARLAYFAVAGCPAEEMGVGPAYAIPKVLKMAGLTTKDIDVYEINEAFAVMPLTSTKLLGNGEPAKMEQLRAKTSVNGGAIAVGHANTATGGRLVMTLAHELKRRGGGYGVAAICGGLGQGDAIVIRVSL